MHHWDRGSQYTSIVLSQRLLEAEIAASVGSVGSSYDNALAETINGLFKTELIKPRAPWKGVDEVEFATACVGTHRTSATSAEPRRTSNGVTSGLVVLRTRH